MKKHKQCLFLLTLPFVIWAIAFWGSMEAVAGYPTKGVDIIVPFAPGGSTDLVARIVAEQVKKTWKQPINVINKAGASGTTGTWEVRNAKPDGYTMLMQVITVVTNPAIQPDLPYKWDDLAFVSRVAVTPLVLIVKAGSPYKTMKDLVEAMKKDPGQFKYGTSGKGGSGTFSTVQMAEQAGFDPTKVTQVVLGGGIAVVTAVAGGHVDYGVQYLSEVIDLIKGNKLSGLAITSEKRVETLPDVPTAKEAGFEKMNLQPFAGLLGPQGIPKEIIDAWNKVLKEILSDKNFTTRLRALGALPAYLGPEEFKAAAQKDFEFAQQAGTRLNLIGK
jgi:tripartite-type tricarboxylate transporter receptor subunit TctC